MIAFDMNNPKDIFEMTGDLDYGMTNMIYPVLKMKLSIVATRPMCTYIKIRAVVKGETLEIGQTETIMGSQEPKFQTEIKAMFYVGIDNQQKVGFDIYDGDGLAVGSGYLFGRIEVPMYEILRPHRWKTGYGIYRSKLLIATLFVTPTIVLENMACDMDKFEKKAKNDHSMDFFTDV